MRKRIASLLLVLALCMTLPPTAAFAEEPQNETPSTPLEEPAAASPADEETPDDPEQEGQEEGQPAPEDKVEDPGTEEPSDEDSPADEEPEEQEPELETEADEAVAAVQALIDALPDAEDITDANADEVSGQLDAIDKAKLALTEEQAAQLDFTRYEAASAALLALAEEPAASQLELITDSTDAQPDGSGTAADPYQITSAAELIWLRDAVNAGEANTCAELRQDVTYVDEVWTSIGTSQHPYTGTFNGNGHTVRVWLDGWGQALFGYVGADGKLTDVSVTKRQSANYSISASAPLARSNAGTITRCWYSGDITAKDSLGGLVYTNSGTIEACYVYTGRPGIGGRIEMYYGGWAGGIAYENTGTIANSYLFGDIVQAQAGNTVGDIIGWGAITYKNSGTVSNCYYATDRDNGYGGKTEDQFRSGEVTYLLNGGTARDDWRQNRYAGDDTDATPVLDRSHAQVRKSGSNYVSLYPHVHCLCGGGATSGGHPQHSDVTFTAWTDDEAASQYGDSSYTAANSLPKNPGNYYLTNDVTLNANGTWRPADGTVLCLNSRTIREFAFGKPAFDTITVDSGVTFSLTECASIQGYIYCSTSDQAIHTVNNSGTFNLYNGRLRGTKRSKADGAAVYNTGTFNMYGGTINDNSTSARGGGVYNADVCNLYGGTITNNGTGGGVYNNGTLTVGGTATVTGNSPNVYLAAGKTITLNSELDESARIGITAEKQSGLTDTAASIIVVKDGAAALNCFFPDDDGTYDLSYNDEDDVILHLIRDHTHCACAHKAKYAKDIGNHTEHVDHKFVAWTDELVKEQYGSDTTRTAATALPKVAGSYYLTGDVTPASAWWAADGTIICMNGHKIVSAGAIGSTVRVDSKVHVVLTDCKASGSISATRATGAAGLGFEAQNGIADIFGVSFSGTSIGVTCDTGNTVNLYNCSAFGNRRGLGISGTVNTAGTVKITSDTNNTSDSTTYCVYNLGTLNVDGTLTVNGGDVGIYNARNRDGSRYGTMTVNGIVTSNGSNSGLNNGGTLEVTGTLTTIGKNSSGLYNGEKGTLTVNGTLTAAGNASSNKVNGLYNAGGTVTVNGTLTASGGQYSVYNYGTLNLSGTVNATKNVYLGTGRTITVVGELDDAASITVQTADTPASGSPVTIATTENADWIKAGSFVSWTPSKYAVSRIDEGRTVVLKAHEHEWGYTLSDDGATITAACANTDGLCGGANGGSVTIQAPADLTYSGTAKAATVTKTKWTAEDIGEITYKKGGSILQAAPTDAGTYSASIEIGGQTASVNYTIEKATPTIMSWKNYPSTTYYTGTPVSVPAEGQLVIQPVNGGPDLDIYDSITFKWYKAAKNADNTYTQGEPLTSAPTDGGDYYIEAIFAETSNTKTATVGTGFTVQPMQQEQQITAPPYEAYVNRAASYVIDLNGYLGERKLGDNIDYSLQSFSELQDYFKSAASTLSDDGKLTISLKAVKPDTFRNPVGTLLIWISSSNYRQITLNVPIHLIAKPVKPFAVTMKGWTYGEKQNTPQYEAAAGTEYTVAYAKADGAELTECPSDAGDYTVTVSYETDTITYSGTADFTISPKELTAGDLEFTDDSTFTKTYDGDTACATARVQIKTTAKVNTGDTLPEVSGSYAYNSPNVAEASKVTFTSEESSSANYILPADLTVEHRASITPAKLYASANSTTAVYGTRLRDIRIQVTVQREDTHAAVNGTWAWDTTDSNNNLDEIIQVGKNWTRGAVFTPEGDPRNYQTLEAGIGLEITQAQQTILLQDSCTITKNGVGVNITAGWSVAAQGVEGGTEPGALSYELVNGPYEGVTLVDNILTVQPEATADSITVKVTAAGTNNYKAASREFPVRLIDRPLNDSFKFDEATQTKTYGDDSFTITAKHSAPGSSVSYSSSNEAVAKVDSVTGEVTIMGAGTAVITATSTATSAFAETAASCTLTVNKRQITITVKDKNVYVGAAAPDLTKPELDKDYMVEGLVSDDKLGGALTLTYDPAPDMTKVGETAIKASGAAAPDGNNYTIKYVDGKLTISKRPSSGGGGGSTTYPVNAPSKTENGTVTVSPKNASKDDTVTITVTPDKGYELDTITVKDASGSTLKLTDKGSGQYTFTMPGSKVTVSAEFVEEQTAPAFADVPADSYFAKAVEWAVKNGITNGKGNGLFGSNDPCTRGQIVTFLWRAAGSPEPKNAVNLTDVPADAYYAKAVAWAIENGITLGTTDTTFSPDAACTRAQSVTFLYRALGKLAVSKAAFSDVPVGSYYADAVAWAVENGVTNGTSATTFSPADGCPRAQIVTFLYRAYQGK